VCGRVLEHCDTEMDNATPPESLRLPLKVNLLSTCQNLWERTQKVLRDEVLDKVVAM